MTDQELTEAFGRLRTLCTNIIGFHGLSEHADDHPCPAADRVIFEAQVYAGGVELARRVYEIGRALEDRAR